jgi:hypothetical protein
LLVKGAGHNESLRSPGVWEEIDRWVVSRVSRSRQSHRPSRGSTGKPDS